MPQIDFIDLIFLLVLIELIRRSLEYIKFIEKSLKYIEENENIIFNNIPVTKKIIILIPVFNEQKIIIDTINYFNQLVMNNNYIDTYIVTSEKEEISPTTFDIIESNLTNCKLKVINCPYHKGDKATQINWAIREIKINQVQGDVYIGIFDADSRPDIRGIHYVLYEKNNLPVYQMYSIYSNNYFSVSLINKANAILQTRWSLGYELPNTLYERKTINYIIGHGVFIRYNLLCQYGLFPEYSFAEDIAIGYKLAFNGVKITPVPYFDYCEVPQHIISNIIQTSRWWGGELNIFKEFIKAKHKINYIFPFFKRIIYLSEWLLGSLIVSLLIFYSICSSHFVGMVLLSTGVYLYIYSYKMVIDRIVSFRETKNIIYLFIIIRSVLSGIGPLLSFFNILIAKLNDKFYFIKTKR